MSDSETSTRRQVGSYEIVREIGRGGMAVVYMARQTSLGRDVALKELSSFHARDPQFAERFVQESRLIGSLNHPNIVTVHEYLTVDGIPYIAMEYLARGSLRPFVGRLSMAQFAGVMEGVLAGLGHAASHGIVHRDLKPENILITEEGRVKIGDFGIAKATQSVAPAAFVTATGVAVGTPAYMAPEQAMAREIGPWTDLYSVGIMAWEHVVGRVPFHEEDAPMAILMRHVNDSIPSAASVTDGVPAALSAWIDRLLVKDTSQRLGTAAAAWEQLEEIVVGELGALWRRQARLPSEVAIADTPRPLTPAPFDSQEVGYETFRPASAPPEPAASAVAPAAALAEQASVPPGSPAATPITAVRSGGRVALGAADSVVSEPGEGGGVPRQRPLLLFTTIPLAVAGAIVAVVLLAGQGSSTRTAVNAGNPIRTVQTVSTRPVQHHSRPRPQTKTIKGVWSTTVGPLTLEVTQVDQRAGTVTLHARASTTQSLTLYVSDLTATDDNGKQYSAALPFGDSGEWQVAANTPAVRTVELDNVSGARTISIAFSHVFGVLDASLIQSGIQVAKIPLPS